MANPSVVILGSGGMHVSIKCSGVRDVYYIKVYVAAEGENYPASPNKTIENEAGQFDSVTDTITVKLTAGETYLLKCEYYDAIGTKTAETEDTFTVATNSPVIEALTASQIGYTKSFKITYTVSNVWGTSSSSIVEYVSDINFSVGNKTITADLPERSNTGTVTFELDDYGAYTLQVDVYTNQTWLSSGKTTTRETHETLTVTLSRPVLTYSFNCTWSPETITRTVGNVTHTLLCQAYPHISYSDFNAFCAGINTVRRAAGLSAYTFSAVSAGSEMAYGLFNAIVTAIGEIYTKQGVSFPLSTMGEARHKITEQYVSDIEDALSIIAESVYGQTS